MTKKMTLEQYLAAVDRHIMATVGLSRDDISDWHYADDYEDGVSPAACAAEALANSGWSE